MMNDWKRGEENLKELLKERDKIDELMRDKLIEKKYHRKTITYNGSKPAILNSE